jgi:uncharacterized membrane protein
MKILTRDETEHDTDYVLAAEAQQEIERLEHTLAQVRSARSATLTEALEWLRRYQEGWYGPKAKWTKEQQTDFEAHAGFLMLYITRDIPTP